MSRQCNPLYSATEEYLSFLILIYLYVPVGKRGARADIDAGILASFESGVNTPLSREESKVIHFLANLTGLFMVKLAARI